MAGTLLSKAISDVASVTAILAMLIAICCELRAAGCTDEMIDRFSFNAVKMVVPPDSAASVRAELTGLLLRGDLDGFTALLAANGVLSQFTIKPISTAEGTNGII